jgi:hypothetical protein
MVIPLAVPTRRIPLSKEPIYNDPILWVLYNKAQTKQIAINTKMAVLKVVAVSMVNIYRL